LHGSYASWPTTQSNIHHVIKGIYSAPGNGPPASLITSTRALSARSPAWEDKTIASFFERTAQDRPDVCAVVDGTTRLSYDELATSVAGIRSGFVRHGVAAGDVITVECPNWWETVAFFHAAWLHGCACNPVVPIYREAELGFIVKQARPKIIVIPHVFRRFNYVEMVAGLLSDIDPAPVVVVLRAQGALPEGFVALEDFVGDCDAGASATDAEAISLLLYTSGTTADPKGVLHNHQTLVCECRSIADAFTLSSDDVVFMSSPLTHITGLLYGVIMPPLLGCSVTLLDTWDPAVALETINREGCTFTVGATPFLQGLVRAYDEHGGSCALRAFLCGGADVPPALVHDGRRVLNAQVVRVYGSSELPTVSGSGKDTDEDTAATTDGRPIGLVEVRLEDVIDGVGELLARGPELFLGYLDPALNTGSFTPDGYFRTGDLASIDERGAITIRGRKKDIIVRGGENISAKEIEDALFQHPDIEEVAVVAAPHPVLGEQVCACVVARDGREVTVESVVAFLARFRMAKQKLPERVELLTELPKTASGKVQKYVLRDRVKETEVSSWISR